MKTPTEVRRTSAFVLFLRIAEPPLTHRRSKSATWLFIFSLSLVIASVKTAQTYPVPKRLTDFHQVHECIERVTGFPAPASEPNILRVSQWSVRQPAMCCLANGLPLGRRGRAFATYKPAQRLITLYRGADEGSLVHELSNDQIMRAGTMTPYA